jgi:hypothetical protein
MLKIGVITMALMSFLHAGWLTNLFDSMPTEPIRIPINLSKAGSVAETEVRVEEKGAYYFSLWFLYTDEIENAIRDSDIARKIAGYNAYEPVTGRQSRHYTLEEAKRIPVKKGSDIVFITNKIIDDNYNLDGTTIPIRLTFSKIEKDGSKKLIKDEIYQTKGAGSNLEREFEKLMLEKGKYSIRVENIDGISEMKNRQANFRFARHGHK